jgi:hypothetical protein
MWEELPLSLPWLMVPDSLPSSIFIDSCKMIQSRSFYSWRLARLRVETWACPRMASSTAMSRASNFRDSTARLGLASFRSARSTAMSLEPRLVPAHVIVMNVIGIHNKTSCNVLRLKMQLRA